MIFVKFNRYLFANCSSFSIRFYGVPSFHILEVRKVELIIFMIATYSFNFVSVIKAINVIVD
jgi:hypothetical protein